MSTDRIRLVKVQIKIANLILNDLGADYTDDALAINSAGSKEELVKVLVDDVGMDLKYVDHVLSEDEMEWLSS